MRGTKERTVSARALIGASFVALCVLLAARHASRALRKECLTPGDLDELERFLLRRPIETKSTREEALSARAAQADALSARVLELEDALAEFDLAHLCAAVPQRPRGEWHHPRREYHELVRDERREARRGARAAACAAEACFFTHSARNAANDVAGEPGRPCRWRREAEEGGEDRKHLEPSQLLVVVS